MDEQLKQVFDDVFGLGPDAIDDEASPHTIEAWDSVGHLNLILALESAFDIQFEAEEIPELATFGAIRERLKATVG